MTKRGIAICLGAAVAIQVVVLVGMVANAAMPLWTGTEIRVKTIPVDPRSMFRGNYARLRYEFGTLPDGALNEVEGLRVGEVVYVSLEQGEGGDYEFAGVSMERPADGICLRGRLVRNSPPLRVKYGIEAFFAPKERALKLESDLRDGGTAVLMVTDGGRAALKDVIPNPDSGSGSGRGHSQSRGAARCPVFEPGSRRTRDVSSYRNPITGVQHATACGSRRAAPYPSNARRYHGTACFHGEPGMAMQPPIHATCHMVSSGHHLATQAGYEVLEAGGNAIDAGVAAGIALGVVHSDLVQFAGVAPIMVYLAEEDRVVTISGLGWWPRDASLDRFVSEFDGHVPTGILRTVVPAAPDAWIASLRRYGTMGFAEVASAAVRYAREGFSVHPLMHGNLVSHADDYRRWPSNRDIYLPGGVPPRVGERFVQTDLGDAIQYMIDEESKAAGCGGREAGLVAARDAFYRGDLARAMVRYHEESGGWLTMEDLAEYESAVEDPVVARLGEIEVYTCGPWCQGPVLAQMASLLDGMDVAAFDHNSVQYIHAVTEAMKLCFADRERHYGDPRFVDVPLARLLSADYGRERRALIRPERAWPGMPPAGHTGGDESVRAAKPQTHPVTSPVPASADTSYCCAIDRLGNCFSATPSDVSWQSPVIPGTGLCPSSRGSQSWAVPGHASCVAPGKRPRLTPNPAFARVRGRQAMPFGTPGGDVQTQAMLQVLLNVTRFGMSTQDAVEAPRFATHSFPDSFEPHEEFPGRLVIEGRIPDSVTRELAARGHDVERVADYTSKMAGVCAINLDVESGIMEGGADPRRMSRAMGR